MARYLGRGPLSLPPPDGLPVVLGSPADPLLVPLDLPPVLPLGPLLLSAIG